MKRKAFVRGKKPPGAVDLVIDALRTSKFEYRTAQGIAKEVHLPVNQVEDALASRPDVVRVSVLRRADGSKLFADRRKVSAIKDAWSAFRAVSFAKFK